MSNVYFGIKKTAKFFLDDENKQYIEYKKLSEGERIQYEDSVNSKLKMHQETKMVEIETKTGSDRSKLIKAAVCGYSILVGEPAEEKNTYSKEEWDKLYSEMDSDLAEALFQEILVFNGFKKKSETTEK